MSDRGATARVRQKDWALTEDAFNRLLGYLDADRERAGEKYEQIRQKLTKLFKWRGCSSPEECADRTLDRVARRIEQGCELHVENPYVYFHGVALNVLREHWREADKETEGIDNLLQSADLCIDPREQQEEEAEIEQREQRLLCLERCIQRLPMESRQLVVKYHQLAAARIDARKRLASVLGIPLNTLRTRVCRIRIALEACVDGCLKRRGA